MKTIFRYAAVLSLALVGLVGWQSGAHAQMDPDESAYANVIVCVDEDCVDSANAFGMEGATVTTYDAADTVIDTCDVVTYPSGLDGCEIAKHDGDGYYRATATAEYAHYTLLSDDPEVLESESHGTQLIWYFAPPADDAAPPVEAPVDELPEVGSGASVGNQTNMLAAAAAGVVGLALAATGMRRLHRPQGAMLHKPRV